MLFTQTDTVFADIGKERAPSPPTNSYTSSQNECHVELLTR